MRTLCLGNWLVVILSIFFCGFGLVTPAGAQFTGDITGGTVNITLTPQYPSPNETVTASLDDYAIDATGATIVWLQNNIEITNTRNNRSISLRTPDVGDTLNISVSLVFTNKSPLEANVSITPVYVDVIVEPLTYTPVFYQGRALPIHGSLVNLTALIHVKNGLVNPANYTYNWQLNNNSIYGGPRTGNNRAQITIPHGQNSVVSLSVTDNTGKLIVRRLISVPAVPVDIKFYEVSTLYGLSQKAITKSIALLGNSSTVRAVPYNLDTRAITRFLFKEWRIDGVRTNTDSPDPFEIILKRQGEGRAEVSFKIRNLEELLQGDEQSFRVEF